MLSACENEEVEGGGWREWMGGGSKMELGLVVGVVFFVRRVLVRRRCF